MLNERHASEPPRDDIAAPPERLDFAGLENSIAFWLRLAQAASFSSFAHRTAGAGLRPGHFAILHLIGANPRIAQTALSRATGRDKSTVTPIVADLLKQGWVTRARCSQDRRAQRLTLTDAGRSRLRELARHAAEHEAALDALVSPENKILLIDMLARIAEGLDGGRPPAVAD
jgi:DNA-binding MarR family transcriptional regulator